MNVNIMCEGEGVVYFISDQNNKRNTFILSPLTLNQVF